MLPYAALIPFVQSMAPSWRKTQHRNLAQVLGALLARPMLCLSELARACPRPDQPLHGRLKRLMRFLDNPRLVEADLFRRWLKLSYRFGDEVPAQPADRPLLPLLVDTTYFEPFAALLAAVPCGSRGLPVALTTYHRSDLTAWDTRRARPVEMLSQNLIETQFLATLLDEWVSPVLCPVVVADRGFARASLFTWLIEHGRDFVIRMDAETCVQLDPGQPPRPVAEAMGLRPGQVRWYPMATYHREDRVPVALMGVWERGQAEPWYLVTTLPRADWTETCYRWRMRIECTNRDEKTGVLLREGDDHHALRSLTHLHRLLLVLCLAEWLCALVGLQAWHELGRDLPAEVAERLGPALPPPVVPHRGPRPPLPAWMKRFAARGPLSYVRLGCEVLRAPDLTDLIARLCRWLATYLWPHTPLWRPWQRRYRLRHGWLAA
jgi:hypothetical protein